MREAGILGEDDRVELLEGEIVEMAPIGSRHAAVVDRLNALFARALEGRAIVRVQSPVRLSEVSEPQPDLALLRPRGDYYEGGHPGPGDVLLVVEVADTRPEYDREVKVPLYGRHEVREAWLVDLSAGRVEVYRGPGPRGYKERRVLGRGEAVAPLAVPDLEVRVEEVLGGP